MKVFLWSLTVLAAAAQAACSFSPSDDGPEPEPNPIAEQPARACPTSELSGHILVDASRDGGVWWYPQGEAGFDPDGTRTKASGSPTTCGQRGYVVDELPRGEVVSDTLLATYAGVIRAGQYGTYTGGRVAGVRLVPGLWLDAGPARRVPAGGRVDRLAESIGIPAAGGR